MWHEGSGLKFLSGRCASVVPAPLTGETVRPPLEGLSSGPAARLCIWTFALMGSGEVCRDLVLLHDCFGFLGSFTFPREF